MSRARLNTRRSLCTFAAATLLVLAACAPAFAEEAPRIVQKDGRYALLVDGKPYLALGGQIHNSSGWPSELPQVWESMAALHANTVEAPVYWEQLEAQPGIFDFANVDAIVDGARAHNLRVVLLWFGTWKEIDGDKHTVIVIQVENESGNIGSVRDFSPEANREIAGQVPADLLAAAGKQPGTWAQVFGGDADELFQAYHQARYINEIAAAGKRELDIVYYVNVWLDYPPAQTPQRRLDQPGIGYPSGGPVRKLVGLWRKLAPALDMIGPDLYSDDPTFAMDVIKTYRRADNPLWIPEVARADSFSRYFFYSLGEGALAFAPFGIDQAGWNILGDEGWSAHSRNFALIAPIAPQLAQLQFAGQVKTAVEEPGKTSQEVDFGDWQATVAFGFPQYDGRSAPGTKDAHGAAVIARLGPDEFLVTGIDASVIFHLPGKLAWMHSQFLTAEQGVYENGAWKPIKLWNGDETDRGLWFYQKPVYVRATMQRF